MFISPLELFNLIVNIVITCTLIWWYDDCSLKSVGMFYPSLKNNSLTEWTFFREHLAISILLYPLNSHCTLSTSITPTCWIAVRQLWRQQIHILVTEIVGIGDHLVTTCVIFEVTRDSVICKCKKTAHSLCLFLDSTLPFIVFII